MWAHPLQRARATTTTEAAVTLPRLTRTAAPRLQQKCACDGASGGGAAPCAQCGGDESEEPALSARAGVRVQRAAGPGTEPATAAPEAAPSETGAGLVVDDDVATLMSGQMRKRDLLAALQSDGCAAADRELARAGRDTRGCPHVERWLAHYAERPASHLERAIRRFAPGAATARAASDYVPLVSARMARGVRSWVETGEVPADVPEELRAQFMGGGVAGAIGGALAAAGGAIGRAASAVAGAIGGAFAAIGRLLFKSGPGGARTGADPAALAARLGPGRPLGGADRTRMESAFGHDFSRVRIHDDDAASALSQDLGARAFTVGEHVAFAGGGFRPGTPPGDALLAHELAHVVQQGGGMAAIGRAAIPADPVPALEQEADVAAADAVEALYAPVAPGRRRVRGGGGHGLRLQRCAGAQVRAPARPGQGALSAADIIALAQDTTVPVEQRGPRVAQAIVASYYPADVGKVTRYVWEEGLDGAKARCRGFTRPRPNLTCPVHVGRDFLDHTTEAGISRRILQIGHELEHIDQHRAGMGGGGRASEREFLAFYWEATATEATGVQAMPHLTRVALIDEALRNYNCLEADKKREYRDRQQRLLTLRVQEYRLGGGANDPTLPATAPTDCPQ